MSGAPYQPGTCGVVSTLARRRWMTMTALVAALALASCGEATARPLPPGRPVVDLTMSDYRFDHTQPVPQGQVVFRVGNTGHVNHRLILVPIPEGFPPIDVQLRGEERRIVEPLAGIPDRPPGASSTFAVSLNPGRYALICFTRDADGESHAAKGMASEFRVS